MENKVIATPKYWEEERFQPLVEAETINGHKVKIPKNFLDGWEMERLAQQDMKEQGLAQTHGLENLKEQRPIAYDMVRVFLEIYQE